MSTMEAQYINEPTLNIGDIVTLRVNEKGELIVASSGGGGDASAAKQDQQTALLTTIDADTSNISTKIDSIDGKTPALGQALAASSVPVVLTAAQLSTLTPPAAITGFATEATLSSLNTKDFATRTNQNTEIASLASIDGKTPALGQALAAASVPVVLTAAQLSTLTPPAAITGFATESTLSFMSSQLSNIDTNTGLVLLQKTLFKNLGANATLNVKSASGSVFGCSCMNLNASARYFQLWNSSTTAGSGTLLFTFLVPANSQIVIGNDYFDRNGILFDTGIAFGFSTTATTYTAGTAADQISTVIYY